MRSLWFIALHCWYSSASETRVSFHESLHLGNIDFLFVLGPLKGDESSLLDQLRRFIRESMQYDLETADLARALAESDSSLLPTALRGPQVVLVQGGDLVAPDSASAEDCYAMLFALEKVLEWRVFGLFGAIEESYLRIPRASLSSRGQEVSLNIQAKYRYSIRLITEEPRTRGYVGPNEGSTLLLARTITTLDDIPPEVPGEISTLRDMQKAISVNDPNVCQNVLSMITKTEGIARVIMISNTETNLCGSRLLPVNSVNSLVIQIKPSLVISRLTSDSMPLWPIPPPVSVEESDFSLEDFDHIIVIPDIHGDLHALIETLWMVYNRLALEENKKSLEDFQQSFTNRSPLPNTDKRVALVQLGDVVDRGPFTIECYGVMHALEDMLGWKVVRLYGNHEIMNFHGIADRYVSEDDVLQSHDRYAEFSLSGSLWNTISSKYLMAARFRSKFSEPHGVLFLHAGIDLKWFDRHERLMNQTIPLTDMRSNPVYSLNWLARYTLGSAADMSLVWEESKSPVWSRSFDELDEATLCDTILPPILEKFGVSMIIVGHCPQAARKARTRCDNRIMLADAMVSRWMGDGLENPTGYVISIADGEISEIDEMQATVS